MWLSGVADGALDPSSRTPLHAQLAAMLRARIANTSLPPGAALPTEAELQEQFGVSRSVVRQALLALTAEGLISRGRGRGSVVAPRGEHHRLVQRTAGLSAQIATEGASTTTEVVELKPERNPRAETELGVSRVLALRRIRSARGEPIALIHTWLPLPLTASLTPEELTDASLHAVMREKLDVVVTSGRRQVRAVAASGEVAGALGVPEGAPVLLLEGTSVDAVGRPVEVFSTWHRADRVIFDIDVVSEGTAGSASTAVSPGDIRESGHAAPASSVSDTTASTELAARVRSLAAELTELSAELERRQ